MKLFLTLSLILHCSLLAVQKPNVVLFLVDDMGAMDTSLPFLTDEKGIPVKHPLNHFYRTPNMERLAAQGTRFSQFYAQSVCSPTRISIMTGQNATRHRTTNWIRPAGNNRSKFTSVDWNWNGLTKSSLTLSRLLAESGYQNIHVGKGHFGPYDHEGQDPLNLGFHVNIGGDSIGQPGSYYGEKNYGNEVKGKDDTANTYGVSHLTNYHGSDTFLSEALTIEAKKAVTHATEEKKPFYLYMAHYALHAPFHSDPRFAKNYLESGKPKKAQAYATLVEGMDKSLGDLLDHLNSLGVGEDTLVLFLGDNGGDAPLGGAHDYGSSAPLRGKKGAHYEGGTRAPFIAAWAKPNPSNPHQKKLPIAQGVTQTQLATVMDLFPTILNLVG
ncbi:sulfatase-like hydrolase/transferase, partial [Akkermansiaceae bacterium]|nr:sulfatase-like hydrolase/transferase [Akkermansiaceae bacterium]